MNDSATPPPRTPTTRQLEKIDRELIALAQRRATLSVARHDAGKDAHAQPQLIAEAVKHADGPLPTEAIELLIRELYGAVRQLVQPVRVCYLGPAFTYSHQAACEKFGQSIEATPVSTIAAAFEAVERGDAQYGMVPLENSTDGRVNDALDCLAESSVQICAEVPLRIRHCLWGIGARSDLRRVLSKPQALSQCRNWLSKHLPDAELAPVASTAEAARLAAAEPDTAAVASRQAGVHYGLNLLAADIQDNAENITRFAVIASEPGEKTGQDKTAVVFEAPHEPGALADAMGIFKRRNLNLTWIESYPVRGARGRYLFFLEFQGHQSELHPRRAIAALEKKSLWLRVLGSYAQAEPIG